MGKALRTECPSVVASVPMKGESRVVLFRSCGKEAMEISRVPKQKRVFRRREDPETRQDDARARVPPHLLADRINRLPACA